MSGQGPLGGCSEGCLRVFWLAARFLVLLALAVVLFVAMACQQPAARPDSNTVNPCAEQGPSRPEGCEE